MGLVWPQAFIVAVLVAVLGTMLLRRSSAAYELVSTTEHTTSRRARPWLRLAVEVALAAGAVVAGARIEISALPAVDVVVTIVWLVASVNAFALLDRYDGMLVGITAVAALGVFVLAIAGDQQATAGAAAAIVGGCLGFLACKRAPSVSLLGDTGRRSLGFAVGLLAITVETVVPPPLDFSVALALLGLPMLSGTMVALGRVRRARPLWADRRDHLYHRLRARGLGSRMAVLVPILVQVLFAALAVVAGRGIVAAWVAAAAGAFGLTVLGVVCGRAKVHRAPKLGFPRWARRSMALGALAVVAVVGPASVALVRAAEPARSGVQLARDGLAAANQADARRSAAHFERARIQFARARGHLGSPMVSLGLAIPGLSSNLEASRALAGIGERLSAAGAQVPTVAEVSQVRVANGSLPIDQLRRLAPTLADVATLLRSSRDRLTQGDWHYLLPPLRRAVDGMVVRLREGTEAAEVASQSAHLLPRMLGGEGTRRYFLAFQNNAELRGTGGLIGNWGELVAERGRLRLDRFGRLDELITARAPRRALTVPQEFLDRYRGFDVANSWQQVNVSPDFPTTAQVIAELYPQSGGRPIDGVIAVDPQGLSALLELTGPVEVPGWAGPITAANVVDVTLRAAYERYPVQDERVEFLGAVARRVSEAFTTADLGNPTVIARSLNRATRGDHLVTFSLHPEEQELIGRLGADGSVPPLRGDFLMAVNQNLSANKVDLYLERRLRYHAFLDPSSRPARVRSQVELSLENGAPSSGLPSGVIGPYDNRFGPGENRTYLSVYTPFPLRSATLQGRPLTLDSQPELSRLAHSATVSVPPLASRTVRLDLEGLIELEEGGWYRLDVGHQPLVIPDAAEVWLEVPAGWRIAETRGMRRVGTRQATAQLVVDRDHSLWVRVERNGWSRFRHRLIGR